MGLASALSTALTGLNAAESKIDVVGNNLANSQTVGFKASQVSFASQFLQTISLGSQPTAGSGGTNPRQVGLGVTVAEITPNFTQGTIQISGSPSDLAIQGDGFFVVEGNAGGQFYSRNGIFKLNSQNELVNTSGNRLLGYGVDELFEIQETELVPLNIPIGSAAVANATSEVFLEGTLTPSATLSSQASILESAVLGDNSIPRADATGTTLSLAPIPDVLGVTDGVGDTGGALDANATYRYKFTFVDAFGTETSPSDEHVVTIPNGDGLDNNVITLGNLPDSAGEYASINVYRTEANGSDFFLLGGGTQGAGFVDDGTTALDTGTPLDSTDLNGTYSYYVTFYDTATLSESRPSELLGPFTISGSRLHIDNIPAPPVPGPGDSFPSYDRVRIYRNSAIDSNDFFRLADLNIGSDYTDNVSDLDLITGEALDFDGPRANLDTRLVDVIRRDDTDYNNLFEEGSLLVKARRGSRSLQDQEFTVGATTTVQEYLDFLENALGIRSTLDDGTNPLPPSANNIEGESGTIPPGASITANGQIRVVANNGEGNAISFGTAQLTTTTGSVLSPNLSYSTIQEAVGESATTDFIVYDSLGLALDVRVTAVLEARDGDVTTYRWFADSADNDPASGVEIGVGTGLVNFDGEGNIISVSNRRVEINRRNTPSISPLEFDLDFSSISGLASDQSTLNASRQDGAPPGKLSSFLIGEDGVIRGSFSNGATQILGQIQLARFSNPLGLEQKGQNLLAVGANSGTPVVGSPGDEGIGTLVAGALELSNTDIGSNLVDLILATTQYRGNTRVVTTAQQLLDELLNLRR